MPNNYDVAAWMQFYADHPGFHRSVGADGDDGDKGGDDQGSGDKGGGDKGGDDNWRNAFSGEDDGHAKQLERFTTQADFGKAYFSAQDRIRAGDLLKPLGEDATADDVKAFRKQQGIPLESKAYLEGLPDGLVIGDDDKETMQSFADTMHPLNLSPAQMHGALGWYNGLKEKSDADQHDADELLKTTTEDIFREEWGSDYRKNTNLINALIEGQFGESAELFTNSRTAEGIPMMSDPGVLKALINISRTINPAAVLVDNTDDPMKSMEDELAGLKKQMREDRPGWNANEAGQKRFMLLVDAINAKKQRGQSQ